MPTIEALLLTPGKSMRPIEDVPTLDVNAQGLVIGDRKYMAVEDEPHINVTYQRGHEAPPGHFLSQREDPELTLIVPRLVLGGVMLSTEGFDDLFVPDVEDTAEHRRPVSVWNWQGEAVDQGAAATEWLSDVLHRPVSLVAGSKEKPRYVRGDPRLGPVGFTDGYPLTGTSPEAYALINQQLEALGKPHIPHNRTRTTFVLSGLEVPNAADLPENFFPEDYVRAIKITNNGLAMVARRAKPSGRCSIPDTDQITGARKGRPVLAALSRLGRHGRYVKTDQYGLDAEVFMSQNFVIELPPGMGPNDIFTITSGAQVDVEYSETTNWTHI